ncbi:MAG: Crp/Fnr family transcriptional regulator [Bacteroidia bacterium]|nr:Crp/Fnr family transcriptional regulator [Bacteroidia bacterium]
MKRTQQPECVTCSARLESVFAHLSPAEIEEINSAKNCSSYKKGQAIFSEGGNPHGLYCVNHGKVKISKSGEEGREQIVRFAKDGDIMGYRALLTGDKYSCSGIAIEETQVCFIAKEIFLQVVQRDSSLALELLKLLGDDLRKAEHRITDLAQKPVRERLAEALIYLKETYGVEEDGSTINVILSREELANIVGTATETAIRLLSEFKSDKIIELLGKKIRIVDGVKLVKTANISE